MEGIKYLLICSSIFLLNLVLAGVNGNPCNTEVTPCYLDPARLDPHLNCSEYLHGDSAPPCYEEYSLLTECSCEPNYRISPSGGNYWCYADGWQNGTFDIECFAPCISDAGPNVISVNSNGTETDMVMDSDTVTYSCPANYTGAGSTSVHCKDGQWEEHAQYTCSASCNLPVNYELVLDGESEPITDGTVVGLKCVDGYEPTESLSAICDDGSFGELPACKLADSCEQLESTDDLLEVNPDDAVYANGTTVTYSCPDGYTLTGKSTATCYFGKWDIEAAPTCQASPCDPLDVTDDELLINPENPSYESGTSITYSCPTGYALRGNSTASCYQGDWDIDTAPTCEANPCDSLESTDNLLIIDPHESTYASGANVTYSCPAGYTLTGNSTASCTLGQWNIDEAPTCRASPCEMLEVTDDVLIVAPSNPWYDSGDTVTYSCPTGYTLIGNSTAFCYFGEWDIDDAPTCEANRCDALETVDNALIISPDESTYASGSNVTYSCPAGYALNGNSTATCYLGDWDINNAPNCEIDPNYCEQLDSADEVLNIDPDDVAYESGSDVTYSCPDGYTLMGNSTASCYQGEWDIDAVPTCNANPCEQLESTDDSVEVNPDEATYESGTNVTYSCPDGYALRGNSTGKCFLGEWDIGAAPICEANACEQLESTDDALQASPDEPISTNGTVVTYSCPEGYTLKGHQTAVCYLGVWDIAEAPTCEANPCDQLNSTDDALDVTPDDATYESGTNVTYSCPEGYTLEGSSTASCFLGGWDIDAAPICKADPCEPLESSDDQLGINPDDVTYESGSKVTYSCPDGYTLEGNSSASCYLGEWDIDAAPTCEADPCEQLESTDEVLEVDPDDATYESGANVTYSCPTGYTLMGSPTATCNSGGWDIPAAPTCEAKSCEQLESADNQLDINPDDATYDSGTNVTYSCPDGYTLTGNSTASCYLGEWDINAAPTCLLAPCEQLDSTDDELKVYPDNEWYESGANVTYSCPDGYTLEGDSTASCNLGQWDIDAAPTCRANPCDPLEENDNLLISNPDKATYESGTSVTYFCPDGYTLNGNSTSTCYSGQWDISAAPTCEVNPCEQLDSSDEVLIIIPDSASYESGANVTYSCSEGFTLMGNSTASCYLGEWDIDTAPSCEANPCAQLESFDDALEVTPDDATYESGTNVTYSCPSGYTLEGNSSASCFLGHWNIAGAPTCTAEPCDQLDVTDDVLITDPNKSSYTSGTNVTYSCPEGYALSGNSTTSCYLGEWDIEEAPTCVGHPCDQLGTDGEILIIVPDEKTYESGTNVTYSCPSGYTLNGNPAASCFLGEWNIDAAPTCEAEPCDQLDVTDDVLITDPNKSSYKSGANVTYSCPEGYALGGNSSASCYLGEWDIDEAPTCVGHPCDQQGTDDEILIIVPDEETYESGTNVTYSCPSGYILNGNPAASCFLGKWNIEAAPTCEVPVCHYPFPSDALVTVEPNQAEYQNGSAVKYSCPEGYDLLGDTCASCIDGEWLYGEDPSCAERNCSDPSPTDENVILSPDLSEYYHGTSVAYSCSSGYELDGASNSTCILGMWDKENPSCDPLPCDAPPDPTDGQVIVSPDQPSYPSGSELRYSCPIGTVIEEEKYYLQCTAGSWDTTVDPGCANCTSGQCALDATNIDRKLNCSIAPSVNSHPPCYELWSLVSRCGCSHNYRLSSTGSSYWCNPDGQWDAGLYTLVCYAPCWLPVGPNVIAKNSAGSVTEVIQDSDYVDYSCPSGYSLSGPSRTTCFDGMLADSTNVYCHADCFIPTDYELADHDQTQTIFNHGDTVALKCQEGFINTDTFNYECEDGSFDEPPCETDQPFTCSL